MRFLWFEIYYTGTVQYPDCILKRCRNLLDMELYGIYQQQGKIHAIKRLKTLKPKLTLMKAKEYVDTLVSRNKKEYELVQ